MALVLASSQSVSPTTAVSPSRSPSRKLSGLRPGVDSQLDAPSCTVLLLVCPATALCKRAAATPIQLSSSSPRSRTPATSLTLTGSQSGVHMRSPV